MIVKVNCPFAGCGNQVQVQNLPKHLEKVHELDGELVLRLHPTSPYQLTAEAELAAREKAEREAEEKAEAEAEAEARAKEEAEEKAKEEAEAAARAAEKD